MTREEQIRARLKKRHAKAKTIRLLGAGAVYTIVALFSILLLSIFVRAWPIFWVQEVALDIPLAKYQGVEKSKENAELYDQLLQDTFANSIVSANQVLSLTAWRFVKDQLPGKALPGKSWVRVWVPLKYTAANNPDPPVEAWLKGLAKQQRLRTSFNWSFFSNADSLSPESAGILAALMGTILVVLIAFCVAFPIGLIVAIYLEEFCNPANKLVRFTTININNLAAVPSIIFGLLGLSIFLGYFQLSRSSALVGGLTLSLMMLPLVIVSSRMALSQVPRTLKEAALGLGASKHQAIFKTVLPTAMPGIITGTLLAVARIIGESAPLLMVGMVVFLIQSPGSADAPATVLPVQIYQWFQRPEPGFVEASSGAIVILLIVLLSINSIALLIRKKFEKFSI